MSYLDLAPSWTDRPLTDPALATDVIDLLLTHGERSRGTFAAILCDPTARFRAVISIDLRAEFPGHAPDTPALCAPALHPIVPALRTDPDAALLLALGRPGPPTCPTTDTEWSTAATHLCRAAQVPLLGFYIATPDHIYQPEPAQLAAA